ncbi:uncharacterized protein G2W53_034934 [Senna tora]|uniref:Uncharacterized protein n=1 Tax=Senna tora TaxID=362788 RepID=A0A834W708_9FABA|nr:uncharacterized protein G2W53_034934 [Senna tora]
MGSSGIFFLVKSSSGNSPKVKYLKIGDLQSLAYAAVKLSANGSSMLGLSRDALGMGLLPHLAEALDIFERQWDLSF